MCVCVYVYVYAYIHRYIYCIYTHILWRAREPFSHLIQEQPTREMVSVGLATHATSNSNRSFSIVLIMLSYLMSTGKSKTKISLNCVVKERVEMAFVAKGGSPKSNWEKSHFLGFFKLNFSLYYPLQDEICGLLLCVEVQS